LLFEQHNIVGGAADFNNRPDRKNDQSEREVNEQQGNECFHGVEVRLGGYREVEMAGVGGEGKVGSANAEGACPWATALSWYEPYAYVDSTR